MAKDKVKKYESFIKGEVPSKEKIKEYMDDMIVSDEIETAEYQSNEDYVNSMLMQEVIMNLGINDFIDVFVSNMAMKDMDEDLYNCLLAIAQEQGLSLDPMYMDNLHATVDMMDYDTQNELEVDVYDTPVGQNVGTDMVMPDSGMAYDMSMEDEESEMDYNMDIGGGSSVQDMSYSMSYRMPFDDMDGMGVKSDNTQNGPSSGKWKDALSSNGAYNKTVEAGKKVDDAGVDKKKAYSAGNFSQYKSVGNEGSFAKTNSLKKADVKGIKV